MPRNDAAAPGHVWPGIGIHAIDIVQPPGIGISPMADMVARQTIVAVALAAKSSAETPRNAFWEERPEAMGREISVPQLRHDKPRHQRRARRRGSRSPRGPQPRSALVVLVVAPPPNARLVTPQWRPVE